MGAVIIFVFLIGAGFGVEVEVEATVMIEMEKGAKTSHLTRLQKLVVATSLKLGICKSRPSLLVFAIEDLSSLFPLGACKEERLVSRRERLKPNGEEYRDLPTHTLAFHHYGVFSYKGSGVPSNFALICKAINLEKYLPNPIVPPWSQIAGSTPVRVLLQRKVSKDMTYDQ